MAEGNQWFLDGNPITDATGQTYNVTQSGSYTVQVSSGGCVSEASEAFTVTNLSDNLASLASTFLLYPNPVSNVLSVDWNAETKLKPTVLEIFSIDGRSKVIQTVQPQTGNISINMNAFRNGLYILKLKGEGFTLQKKIIKQ